MNRLVRHISKTMALLAITSLLVQQVSAAACCCRGGLMDVKQTAVGSATRCCSQSEAKCCGSAGGPERSCCEQGAAGSKSKPCRCPTEYHEKTQAAADLATPGSSPEDDLSIAVVQDIPAIACATATRHSTIHAVAAIPVSGSERCVQLCRYRL